MMKTVMMMKKESRKLLLLNPNMKFQVLKDEESSGDEDTTKKAVPKAED